ncbi:hypothetical protein DCCM_0664 [Desulfocucumis palustris]|uniref:Uncharacterized protein n=1 Tax=Desulfocucumis palustris TaxID=1898651 RepID=A0A2L2X8N4_9FIRM|nr:hypothetical protein [Desulfocucumis palustris]GBF32468.1 hypothetical protein DCCM_0664 [Desulfocucumis palustris]
MKISINELKFLFEILIKKAEEAGFNEFVIDKDNYWLVSSSEREDFTIATPEVSVGSMIDDVESLQKVLEGINIPTPVDFDRFANILIAVGDMINRSDKVY